MGDRSSTEPAGALRGVRVVDLSALGPGPFCSMLLADHGAEVVTVERPEPDPFDAERMFGRGKRSIVVDLDQPAGRSVIRDLAARTDVFLEGSRPGTMERLGLGPDELLGAHAGLIYVRLTGFGQHGPLAAAAGHDINYISIGGPLGVIGRDFPVPPANLVGDFAAGSLMAVVGICLALLERARTGMGQVIDAAMSDGAALLIAGQLAMRARGQWGPRGTNLLDGSAPFYRAYECSDGGWVAVGAIEPRFYTNLITRLVATSPIEVSIDPSAQYNETSWSETTAAFERIFRTRPRQAWIDALEHADACVTPVLELDELARHPHHRARGSVTERDGESVPAPAPRLGRSGARLGAPVPAKGADTDAVLLESGRTPADIEALRAAAVVQ